jgi:CubicO group peptidase (beta-lactamase class C family)
VNKLRVLPTTLLALILAGCGRPDAAASREASTAAGQDTTSKSTTSEVEARIERVEDGLILMRENREIAWGETGTLAERMAHYDVPGLSIAVINDFEIEWARGYGVMEAGSDDPVTTRTLFHAGSVAKTVAAAAALQLVERGSLDLDENVNPWLRSWRIPENEYTEVEKVTLRRLLSHSAGLSDGWTDSGIECCYSVAGAAPPVTILEMLEADPTTGLEQPTRVTRVPGTEYQYSNLGYAVLELLLADVTGERFSELVQAAVFEPLDMSSSTFEQPLPEDLRERSASEHYEGGRPFEGKRHHFPVRAAGGLWATPTDLARFGIEVMRAYVGVSDRFLSHELAVEMVSPQIAVRGMPIIDARGLAFGLTGEGEAFAFFHTGGTWGSTSVLWAIPSTGQGAVVMTNAGGNGLIRFEILLAIAAEYGWPD